MSPPWHCEWLHFWVSWTIMDGQSWMITHHAWTVMLRHIVAPFPRIWHIWCGWEPRLCRQSNKYGLVTVELPTGGYAEKLSGGDAEYFWTSWLRLVQRHIYIILQAGMVVVYGPWKQGSSRCGVWNSSIWLNSWDLENIIFYQSIKNNLINSIFYRSIKKNELNLLIFFIDL